MTKEALEALELYRNTIRADRYELIRKALKQQPQSVDVEGLKEQVLSQAKHDLITNGNEEIYEIVRLLTVNCIDYLESQGYLQLVNHQ
jgi:hypothetical protein